MSEHRFEFIEHTADIGVEAEGATMAEAFESAAYGMFSVMAEIGGVKPTRHIDVRVEGEDVESLLRAWLSELIFHLDAHRVLPVEFKIEEVTDTLLLAKVGVCPAGPDIEWSGPAIKAVTYHQLAVEQTEEGWKVRVIFDV